MTEIFSDDSSCDEIETSSSQDHLPLISEDFGRYRIERPLGAGAMGSVLLAHDTILERQVALKIPVLRGKDRDKTEQRFFREARAAAGIDHPNICPIYDVGIIDETFFISMGYIEGKTLAHLMDECGQFPQDEAANLVRQLALALHEAHAKGVVHRDLKPNNIMIDRRGEPIVMDFGLAYSYENEEESRLTHDGMTVGTPGYMSPEQVCGSREIGPASDIFSLGILLYELVCGKRPFTGKSMVLMGHIAHGEPIDPKEFREDFDPSLEAICFHALEKKPLNRFESMQEFANALDDFNSGRPLNIQSESSTTSPELSVSEEVNDTVREQPSLSLPAIADEQRKSSTRTIIFVVLACSIGIFIGGWVFGFFSEKPNSPTSQKPEALVKSDTPNIEPSTPKIPPAGSGRGVLFDPTSIPVGDFDPAVQFAKLDLDGDGILSPRECPRHIIERADADLDGQLANDEFISAHERLGEKLTTEPSPEELRKLRADGPRGNRPPPRRPGNRRPFDGPPPRRLPN